MALQDHISVEAIKHQFGSTLFSDINKQIKLLREATKVGWEELEDELKRAGRKISRVIMDHTGLFVTLEVYPEPSINAAIDLPVIDANHPLIDQEIESFMKVSDDIEKLFSKKDILEGSVDLNRSRVSGVFSEIEAKLYVTDGLLQEAPSFSFFGKKEYPTTEEITAVILHELGHLFSFYELLGTTVRTNFILDHASRVLMETESTEKAFKIISSVEKEFDIKIDDPVALKRSKSKKTVQAVFLKKYAEKKVSDLKSARSDATAFEALSDQFAVRHGAGKHLATALVKIYEQSGDTSLSSKPELVLANILQVFLLANPFIVVLILTLIYLPGGYDVYDKPKQRILRIRRDMVAALKDRSLDKRIVKKYKEDIKRIDELLQKMNESKTMIEFVLQAINPWKRREFEQMEFQREVEGFVNNDLYLKSSSLRTL